MRVSTSWNQVNGSTLANSHDATKLRATAIVLPPRVTMPTNVQLCRPIAMPRRLALGVVIVDGQIAVFQVARHNAVQFFSA